MDSEAKPNFVLTGTYSSFNKGDAAMQLATANELKKKWPNCTVTVLTPFPHYDRDTYKDYKMSKTHRRNLPVATILLLIAWLYRLLSGIGLKARFLLISSELKASEKANAIIDLSGDTITEDYGPHVTYSHLLPIMIGQALGTATYICGQSIGPFKLTTRLVKKTLKHCDGIAAREEVTYNYLKDLGVPIEKLYLESDMAFLLQPADRKRTEAISKTEKIDTTRPILGVTVSGIIRERFNENSDINFDKFLAQTLDKIIGELDVNVLFIGHVTGPSDTKDDRLVAQSIHVHMSQKNRAFVLKGNYTPQELKGIIGKCSLFLGSRMHSNIAALSTYVPTVALSYSHKTIGIMRSLDMGKYVLNGNELNEEKLFRTLQNINQTRSKIHKQLEKLIPEIQKSSRKNISHIESIIQKGHYEQTSKIF